MLPTLISVGVLFPCLFRHFLPVPWFSLVAVASAAAASAVGSVDQKKKMRLISMWIPISLKPKHLMNQTKVKLPEK